MQVGRVMNGAPAAATAAVITPTNDAITAAVVGRRSNY